ncbi:hypothetical protein GCM10027275_09380 [Rhabdobacter roseus]|uniref:CheY-like chemotaxis protein n=1 Tax=Rhabdobacter roseus TaxID=1655419 RepID=A0A840TT40_9BACT|nr:response regulator [Rhabdobacter roseus]MBB5282839.1 CheY-like chemotaxis protein [Rhabdobacter roseus]
MLTNLRQNPKPTIFLVDDDEDDRFLFLDAIKHLRSEIEFREFVDGESFVKTLSSLQAPPDAIFLDLNLPKRNGIECLDYLRQQLGATLTKVFIISTSSSTFMIEKTKERGADFYIRKSENFANLKRLIQIALKQLNAPNTVEAVPYYLNQLVEE